MDFHAFSWESQFLCNIVTRGTPKSILASAIAELEHGLSRNRISSFYVREVVGVDNEPSKRASAATISSSPTAIIDNVSGLPALHYVRKIG